MKSLHNYMCAFPASRFHRLLVFQMLLSNSIHGTVHIPGTILSTLAVWITLIFPTGLKSRSYYYPIFHVWIPWGAGLFLLLMMEQGFGPLTWLSVVLLSAHLVVCDFATLWKYLSFCYFNKHSFLVGCVHYPVNNSQKQPWLISKYFVAVELAFPPLDYPHENLVQKNFCAKNLLILYLLSWPMPHRRFFDSILSGTFVGRLGSCIGGVVGKFTFHLETT